MKRFLVFLMTAVLLLGMVSFARAEEQTTIRVLWWGTQTRHDLTGAAIEKFMEKNPDIKVEAEFTDWSGYWSKLATQAAGGLVPDVVQMDYAYITQYAKNKVLADLTPYIESGALDVSDTSESLLASGQVDEGIYGVPCGANSPALLYRKDFLEKAGVTVPLAPTESEYQEIVLKVYQATGRAAARETSLDAVRNYVRNYGMNLYNNEGTALGFDDPVYIVRVWERYLSEVASGVQLGIGEATQSTAFDAFASDVWMSKHYTNELTAYETGSGCKLELAMVPTEDDATTPATYIKPTMFWSVANNSAAKDAAIRFVDFCTNDPDYFDIVGVDRGIPISSKIREHLEGHLSENDQKVVEFMNFVSLPGNTSPIMKADIPVHNELVDLYSTYFEQVQYELIDDLTAHAQAFMDEANAIIAKSLEAE